jgi:hypothetical protein
MAQTKQGENLIEFLSDEYVLGVWFAEKNRANSLILVVKKRKGVWKVDYMFKFPDGSKKVRTLHVKSDTEDNLKTRMEGVFNRFRKKYDGFHDYVDIRGDYHKAQFKLAMTDWIGGEKDPRCRR